MKKTLIIDDFDGQTTDGVKSVTLILDSERWNLDLGTASLKALKDALKPFTSKVTAQKLSASRGSVSASATRPGLMEWLVEQGLRAEGQRGRATNDQVAAYDAAH